MKIKFGAIVVDGRGKVGGHVMSKNRGGAYMRTKVTPINPQTVDQLSVRSAFTSFSQSWRALAESARLAWNSAVSSFTKTDIFGDIKTPSGINLFMKLNMNLNTIGEAPLVTPPGLTDAPPVVEFTATADASPAAMSLAYAPTPVPADTSYVVEATPMVSPGKSFLKNQYRVIQVVPAAGVTPANVLAAYNAKFGALVAGYKIGIRIRAVSNVSGVSGLPFSQEVIVTA